MKYKAAIFDMDGTILDTISDLANAVRYSMRAGGHRDDFAEDKVRFFFGSGAHVAFQRALACEAGETPEEYLQIGFSRDYLPDEAARLQEIFAEYYPNHCEERTKAYPGLTEALDELRGAGVRLAVVSNKIDPAVQILAEQYFPGRFDFAIGISENNRRKPFPDMLEKCLQAMEVSREDVVYVGDSEVDIQTAENMDVPCISVAWGSRSDDFLRNHGAKEIIRKTAELTTVIL